MNDGKSMGRKKRKITGQAVVEYAIILSLIAVTGIASLSLLGTKTNDVLKSLFTEGETEATDISSAAIAPVPNQKYTGLAITPEPEVTLGENVLVAGTDFDYSYENNTEIGTATITVSGKGSYTGSISTTFEIVNGTTSLTLTWSSTSFTCDNTQKVPEAKVTGLKAGDAATVTVSGGKCAPGTYTATATLNFTSGNASDYVITNSTCPFTISAANTCPTLAAGKLRTILTDAGYDETTYKVCSTEIVSCYEPTGDEVNAGGLNIDTNANGDIKAYLLPLAGSGTYKMVISGNGYGKMYCNSDSTHMFTSSVQATSSGRGSLTGLSILDVSKVTDATYMFSSVNADSVDISGFNFSSLSSVTGWFSNAQLGTLTITSSDINGCDLVSAFEGATISSSLDVGGLDVSGCASFESCFADSNLGGTVDLSAWNMSSATSLESMFERTRFTGGRLKVNAWDTSNVTSLISTFEAVEGLETINISKWNLGSVKTMFYTFNQAECSSVYINGPTTGSCSNFTNTFGGSSSGISAVYSPGDFDVSGLTSSLQKPFVSNKHYTNNTTLRAQSCLLLTTNGGVIIYSAQIDDV